MIATVRALVEIEWEFDGSSIWKLPIKGNEISVSGFFESDGPEFHPYVNGNWREGQCNPRDPNDPYYSLRTLEEAQQEAINYAVQLGILEVTP